MIWFIVLVMVVIAAILIFNMYQNKYQSAQGTIFNVVVTVLLIFLAATIGYVYFKSPVKVENLGDVVQFTKVYFSWVGHFFGNLREITGYAVNQDWSGNVSSGGG